MEAPRFNEVQTLAIGTLVCDHWGGHMQTGFEEGGDTPILLVKMGPNHPVLSWTIEPDGTVTER